MKEFNKNFIINKFKPDELKGLEKYLVNLKELIFGAFYILLINDSDSYIFFFICSLIEFMQLIFFSFQVSILEIWKNEEISSLISKILDKVYINYYFRESDNSTIFLVIFYLCFFIVVQFAANFVYLAYIFTKSIFSNSWNVVITKYSCKLIISCLYLPLLMLFFSIFNCNSELNTDTETYMTFANNIKCYSGFHYLHILIGVIGILMLIIFGVLISLTYFESLPKFKGRNSKYTTDYDVILCSAKILIVIFYTFLPNVSFIKLSIFQII